MALRLRWTVIAVLFGIPAVIASLEAGQFRYWSGQTVAPVFEGWERNPDGSFDFLFGYFNRNHEETLDIPVGPNNNIEPGGPDQGQPTFFAPLRNQAVFRVKVPKGWDPTRRLVWTLSIRGKTERANAFLLPEWETNNQVLGANRGPTIGGGGSLNNTAPTITVVPEQTTIALRDTLTFTASVADDGVPRRRAQKPDVENERVDDRGLGVLRVDWLQHRGPTRGRAVFMPVSALVAEGKAITTASFTAPGQYVLRAFANDGEVSTAAEVVVTVGP